MMNKIIKKERKTEKDLLIIPAKKLIEKLEASGIKQGILASRIGISQNTLCRFMKLDDRYLTKNLINNITVYIDKNLTTQ